MLNVAVLAAAASALAEVRYVDVNSTNATPPYTNWATAARNIQDAVDAAAAGDEVVVTNGIYSSGGRAVYGTMTNRVTVDKPLTLRSVNGPQFTVIQGWQVPGALYGIGDGAIRCVYLTNGASLSGFTLTKGATRAVDDYPTNRESSGGGLWCESTNDVIVSNCVVAGNSAYLGGGGAYAGTLKNCAVTGNNAFAGGGSYGCTLHNCTVTGNSATGYGAGGGAAECALNNCTVSGNLSSYDAGGAWHSTLNNCTLTGNSASYAGGGSLECTMNNCIIYFNTAPQGANYDTFGYTTLNYCCTTPQPTAGVGNIASDPQLASSSHLSAGSPCRGAGNVAYATGTDIDGEVWLSPPSVGCDEYHAGALTGPLCVGITASYTNVLVGYAVQFTAITEGRTAASSWDFGDGITATNQAYAAHEWTALGEYGVVLRAYNESWPGGISATTTVHVVVGVHYVAANSANPVAPYTSWAKAATNIQDAINAAEPGGAQVLVTDGIYAPIALPNLLSVRSLNGPQVTVINGGDASGCAYVADGASLSGFTLTHGGADYSGGGGVRCQSTNAVVSNCVLSENVAGYPGGGGGYGGTLNNCTLIGNLALSCLGCDGDYTRGGGAYECVLNNCTLTGNQTIDASGGGEPTYGGGAYGCRLNNCIVYNNSPDDSSSYYYTSNTLNYCWTSDPGFVDSNSWANLRLQSNSPCINAGNNSYATSAIDLDGNPRISGGTVDIGAYEYQWPQLTIAPSGPNVLLRWPTNNAGYDYTGFSLQSTTNLGSPAVWSTNSPAPVVINGQNVVINPITGPQQFFRLKQ
jgi:hypothetical protein